MKKNLYNLLLLSTLGLTAVLSSCSKWDEYKSYTNDKEVQYSGKVDSATIYPGYKRAKVWGKLNADPKIKTIKVLWNGGADSAVFDAQTAITNNIFSQIVPVAEGLANFTIYTYDAAGNRSVPVYASSAVYGDVYQDGLSNRLINSTELQGDGSAKIDWADVNANAGIIGMKVMYTNTADASVDTLIPSNTAAGFTTMLPNYKPGSNFQYRTLYKPVPVAIDTFYSANQSVGVKYEVTSLYIKNAGPNFANSDGGNGRWQIPADWIVTDDVRNDNGLGGLDNGGWLPSKALSIEAWWGMPAVPNGKVYQTFTLPAGKYAFEMETGDVSDGATKYMTIAAGSSLPDIDKVAAQAIAYTPVSKYTTLSLKFELSTDTQVAMGIQANMPAEGNFMKVFKVKLFSLP